MPNSVETELSCLNWNSSVSIQTFPIPFAVSISISIYLYIHTYIYIHIYICIYIEREREKERERERTTLFYKFPIRSLLKCNQLAYGPVVLLTLQSDLDCITNCSEFTLPQVTFPVLHETETMLLPLLFTVCIFCH